MFKNKKKKRIIKGYATEYNARQKYQEILKNNKVLFPLEFENAEFCSHEIGLLTTQRNYQLPLYNTDEYGRNEKVFVENQSDYTFIEIKPFQIEEKIYDCQTDSKIEMSKLIKDYCPVKEFKSVFTLNNKLIIQIDEDFKLFSLKNIDDTQRALKVMENYFIEKGRRDAIFVRDISTTQRKWLYNVLEENGFDRKKLYRQHTTYSKR